MGHTKLITVDNEIEDHPVTAQKPYMPPLKHTQWVKEELEMLENSGIITHCVSSWSSPIVIVSLRGHSLVRPPEIFMCAL